MVGGNERLNFLIIESLIRNFSIILFNNNKFNKKNMFQNIITKLINFVLRKKVSF